jgi:hypothetical protein
MFVVNEENLEMKSGESAGETILILVKANIV